MLSCIIDGQAKSFPLDNTGSLANLLGELNSNLTKEGRFITSLKVDGEEMEDCAFGVDRELEGIDTIVITTETPICLVGKILDEGQNYIDGLMDFLRQVAVYYSTGSERADGAFSEAVQGLQWFVQMTDYIECTLKLDFSSLTVNGRTISENVDVLNKILLQMADSQETNDSVMLVDILEYDLALHLAEWKNIYNLISDFYHSKS